MFHKKLHAVLFVVFVLSPLRVCAEESRDKFEALESRVKFLETKVLGLEERLQKCEAHQSPIDAAFATRAVPYFREGKLRGLRVFALKEGDPLKQLGFCNGDIVMEIDEKPLADALALLRLARGEKAKSVKVDRNGKEFDLLTEKQDSPGCTSAVEPAKNEGPAKPGPVVSITKEEFESLIKNQAETLTQMRAVPYFKNGQAIGARIFAIRNGSFFEKIGLQNGDILLEVDSEPVSGVEAIAKLIESVKQGERRITLERSRERLNIGFMLK